jgi:hypothetical protein
MNLRDINDQSKISLGEYLFNVKADAGVAELLQLDPMVWMYAEQKARPPHLLLMAQQARWASRSVSSRWSCRTATPMATR